MTEHQNGLLNEESEPNMAKSQKTQTTLIATPDAVDLIRFEKNLLQIGFFGAHERRGPVSSSRRIEQWVNREGKKIRVSAEFRSSKTLGLPSTADRDKYMAFMKLAMDQKKRIGVVQNPIRFSGYSLLNTLSQCDSGENYEALNQWGMRMADTTITSEQIIYSSSSKRYMNKTVHVFRSFTRLGTSALDNTARTDMFEVELEDWLLENLNESFVVPEDFKAYQKLVRPTAKGIFVYLYVWFYASKGREVEKDYAELCNLLNVRRYEHLSKIKETMGLSLADLVNIGYLESWDIRPMSSKDGYKLVLAPGRAMQEVLLMTERRLGAGAGAGRGLKAGEGERKIAAPPIEPDTKQPALLMERLQMQVQYEEWCFREAESWIEQNFSAREHEARLKRISSQLRKNEAMATLMDRMTPKQRKAELGRHLRKEVAKEMGLPDLEEWGRGQSQSQLF